jgi:hypothetical protein
MKCYLNKDKKILIINYKNKLCIWLKIIPLLKIAMSLAIIFLKKPTVFKII